MELVDVISGLKHCLIEEVNSIDAVYNIRWFENGVNRFTIRKYSVAWCVLYT